MVAAANSRPATTTLPLRGTSDKGRCIMFSMTSIDDEIAAMQGMPEFGDGPNNVYDHFVGGVAQ